MMIFRQTEDIIIRMATPADAAALLEIYRPYVEKTAITFEYDVPTVEEFRRRIEKTLKLYPYLVVQQGQTLVGYAYAGVFKDRAAYDWGVETSIYLREDQRGKGLGKALYQVLEELLARQNIANLNACIAYRDFEDETLTKDSVRFHGALGYRMIGTFHDCGYKFGQWYDMVWMEKMIAPHKTPMPPVIPVGQLKLG